MGIRMSSVEKLRFISCLFHYLKQILDRHRHIYYKDPESNNIIGIEGIKKQDRCNKKLDKFTFQGQNSICLE